MAQLAALVVTQDDEFRRQIGQVLRSGGVPVGLLEDRRPAGDQTVPDLVVVDIRGDVPSGLASIERLRATHHDDGDLRRRHGGRARPDPAGDARRRQRVLHVAGARRVVPGRGPPHAYAPRERAGLGQAAVGDAGLLRRQGRRRHDDRGGQLRGGAGPAHQAPDRDRRPEARLRRGRAVSRRAAPVHRPRRAREPAPDGQGLPARAAARSTSRGSRFSPAPSSSSGRAPATPAPSKSCSACSASRTTTSSSTPATR